MNKLTPVMKPLLINNLEFSASEQLASGSIELTSLQRLGELLVLQVEHQEPASIQYTLAGSEKKHSLPSLHLTINASLPAICQRCLNEVSVQLKLSFDYLINDTEPVGFDENDDLDWLEASREMNVWGLVEDELLIAFPIAPMHSAQQQECIPYTKQSGEKPNPFAVLKDFAKKSN